MKAVLDFSLDAWIRNLEVEGKNKQEILDNLKKMSIYDIVSDGEVKSFELHNVDLKLTEVTYSVKAYNITYDEDDAKGKDLPNSIDDLKISVDPNGDIDLEVEDAIYDKVNVFPTDFDYELTLVEE